MECGRGRHHQQSPDRTFEEPELCGIRTVFYETMKSLIIVEFLPQVSLLVSVQAALTECVLEGSCPLYVNPVCVRKPQPHSLSCWKLVGHVWMGLGIISFWSFERRLCRSRGGEQRMRSTASGVHSDCWAIPVVLYVVFVSVLLSSIPHNWGESSQTS